MRLTTCDCRAEHYRRGHRHGWMKLLGTRRLYHCYACDAILFIAPEQVSERLDSANAPLRRPAIVATAVALSGS